MGWVQFLGSLSCSWRVSICMRVYWGIGCPGEGLYGIKRIVVVPGGSILGVSVCPVTVGVWGKLLVICSWGECCVNCVGNGLYKVDPIFKLGTRTLDGLRIQVSFMEIVHRNNNEMKVIYSQ